MLRHAPQPPRLQQQHHHTIHDPQFTTPSRDPPRLAPSPCGHPSDCPPAVLAGRPGGHLAAGQGSNSAPLVARQQLCTALRPPSHLTVAAPACRLLHSRPSVHNPAAPVVAPYRRCPLTARHKLAKSAPHDLHQPLITATRLSSWSIVAFSCKSRSSVVFPNAVDG
jgi:hypothetical protein